jgi:hypothetical protein
MAQVWDVRTLTEKGTDAAAQITNILGSTQGSSPSFDDAGFLCKTGTRLVWRPAINRSGTFAMYGISTVAVGAKSGSVTIIRFYV